MPNKVTIREVAAAANVSISTVSRYLNKKGNISQAGLWRIEEAIERLNYTPNSAARSLRGEGGKTVLLIVPDICNPFYSQIAKTAQWYLRDRGYAMILFDSNDSYWELNALDLVSRMPIAGILLSSMDMKIENVRKFEDLHIPVVLLGYIENSPFDIVAGDMAECMYIATQYLITMGHKRIAFAGGNSKQRNEYGRIKGYIDAMHDNGLTVDPQNIVEVSFSQQGGYQCGCILAERDPLPTAVCCANDVIALGLMSAMWERGIAIPEQISVTGLDDIPYDQISRPGLTSVSNAGESFAKEGVRLLLDRIEGAVSSAPRRAIIKQDLIVRGSVKPCMEK